MSFSPREEHIRDVDLYYTCAYGIHILQTTHYFMSNKVTVIPHYEMRLP